MSQLDRNSLRSWLPKFSGLRTLRGRLMGLLGTMFLITLLVIGMSVVAIRQDMMNPFIASTS